jgi:hypothetical protein
VAAEKSVGWFAGREKRGRTREAGGFVWQTHGLVLPFEVVMCRAAELLPRRRAALPRCVCRCGWSCRHAGR